MSIESQLRDLADYRELSTTELATTELALTAALENIELGPAYMARLWGHVDVITEQRDRARNAVVAVEQELAEHVRRHGVEADVSQ